MNIPQNFSKNGYEYILLEYSGKFAFYKTRSPLDPHVRSYEVLIARSMPERALNGKVLPASIRLPSNEEFGKYGWSYTSEATARKKFDQITRKVRR